MKKVNPKVRVLLASGFIKSADLEKIKEEGIKGFIKKPYFSEDLFREIDLVLHQS